MVHCSYHLRDVLAWQMVGAPMTIDDAFANFKETLAKVTGDEAPVVGVTLTPEAFDALAFHVARRLSPANRKALLGYETFIFYGIEISKGRK